ncbi:MAG: RDD family protein [Proteobacteria bacterium]|nr:RDD family protein [Pseudomonadota bacterium]
MTEPDPQDYPRAGLLRRFAALLYDAFLVAAIWMFLGFMLQLIFGPDTSQLVDGRVQTDPLLDSILFSLMLVSCAGFYIWFWTHSGQTLGMLAWRLKVVTLDGGLINPIQGVIRFATAWPAFFMFGLGYLWLYIDPQGDAVHDKLSSTKVVVLHKSH